MNSDMVISIIIIVLAVIILIAVWSSHKIRIGFKILFLLPIAFFIVGGVYYMISNTGREKESQAENAQVFNSDNAAFSDSDRYMIGESWTVDNQWALTINSVRETDDITPAIKKEPAAVYIVHYTIENLGYEKDGSSGLYLSLDTDIKDSSGAAGYAYLADEDPALSPGPAYAGEKKEIEIAIGVDHAGDFEIGVFDADMNGKMQKALFEISVTK